MAETADIPPPGDTARSPVTSTEPSQLNPGRHGEVNSPPNKPEASDDNLKEVANSAAEAPKKPQTLCSICNKVAAKYKCPRCSLAYCSVACSKIHRENHPPEEERKPPPTAAAANEAQAKNNTHPFGVLDESKELQRLFTKYPNLKTKLKTIHDASLPGRDDDVLRNGPIRSNPHGKKPNLWTPEVGLRRSQQALRRARTDPGEDGDGVREYCELVVYLLSRAGERDATAIVRDEVAQEELKVIQQLMKIEE